jgi:hypothetical protein
VGRRSVTRTVATRVKCGVRMSVVCFFVVHGLRDDVGRSAPPMPEKSGGRANTSGALDAISNGLLF